MHKYINKQFVTVLGLLGFLTVLLIVYGKQINDNIYAVTFNIDSPKIEIKEDNPFTDIPIQLADDDTGIEDIPLEIIEEVPPPADDGEPAAGIFVPGETGVSDEAVPQSEETGQEPETVAQPVAEPGPVVVQEPEPENIEGEIIQQEAAPQLPPVQEPAPVQTIRPARYVPPATVVPELVIIEEEPETSFFLSDKDGDNFTDIVEIRVETDLSDPMSHPPDANNNGIDDRWEAKYGITENGKDLDGDGLYDHLEYLYGTNPSNADTDVDTYSDAQEVLDYGTDPLDSQDPVSLDDLGVRITSFQDQQLIADENPLIKGVAPPLSEVEILTEENGDIIGEGVASDNYLFLIRPFEPFEEGEYTLIARILSDDADSLKADVLSGDPDQSISAPVKVKIMPDLDVDAPRPERLSKQPITEEIILNNLRVEIEDDKPVLYGNSNFMNQVTATWNSIVLTSALIADSPAGEFAIEPSMQLGAGDHEVYVQAVRPSDSAISELVKVSFHISEQKAEILEETMEQPKIQILEEEELKPAAAAPVQEEQNYYLWAIIVIGAGVLFFTVYFIFRRQQ